MPVTPNAAVGTAPGKVILFGEHSVVYGHPALGVALGRGAKVTLRRGAGEVALTLTDGLELPAGVPRAAPEELVRAALGAMAGEVDADIELAIPAAAGFGASAAIAVALLRARQALGGEPPSLAEAIAVEDVVHGRSSGLDPAIVMTGGVVEFRPGVRRAREVKVRRLAPASSFHLVLAFRGTHGGTAARVEQMAEWKVHFPRSFKAGMAALGAVAQDATRGLLAGELDQVGKAMDLAHGILSGFGRVGEAIDQLVRLARSAGALGAKMSGAGGDGGAMVALAADIQQANRIREVLDRAGARAWIETAAE